MYTSQPIETVRACKIHKKVGGLEMPSAETRNKADDLDQVQIERQAFPNKVDIAPC